jgi:hypothetical protein
VYVFRRSAGGTEPALAPALYSSRQPPPASDPSAAHHDAGKMDVEPCAYIGTLLADGL